MQHTVFKHSGNAGDIIYAMAGIKQACANDGSQALIYLWLDRPGFYYQGAQHPLGGVMLNAYMFNMLKPLLEAQPYVEEVRVWNYEKVHVDLDKIRTIGEYIGMPNGNIARWYYYKYPDMATDLSQPWLSVDGEDPNFYDKILVNRTSRYQNPHINYSLLRDYDGVVFTGIWEEYQAFKKQVPNAAYLEVKDFYELATAIKSCRLFIGNQSMCYAIAEAMKVPRVLETCSFAPNVIPEGPNGYDFYFEKAMKFYIDKLYNNVRPGIMQQIIDNRSVLTDKRIPDEYTDIAWQAFKQPKPIESNVRMYHTSCDAKGRIDGVVNEHWASLTKQVDAMIDADIVCLDLSWFQEFEYDPGIIAKIKHMNKKVVVVDYIEYGREMDFIHLVGVGKYNGWSSREYEKLEAGMAEIQNNIVLYFKREAPKQPKELMPYPGYPILPIDYYCQHDNEPDAPWDPESRDIDILMIWGQSHPIRPLVAGELMKQSFARGRHLVTTVEQCDMQEGQKVAVIYAPHYARMHPLKMFDLQSRAKITISLPGAGMKCFRDSEAPFNSIMAKLEDNVERAYEWINGENCISFSYSGKGPETMENVFINHLFFYLENPVKNEAIYLDSQATIKKYVRHRYVKDHILANIEKVLREPKAKPDDDDSYWNQQDVGVGLPKRSKPKNLPSSSKNENIVG